MFFVDLLAECYSAGADDGDAGYAPDFESLWDEVEDRAADEVTEYCDSHAEKGKILSFNEEMERTREAAQDSYDNGYWNANEARYA